MSGRFITLEGIDGSGKNHTKVFLKNKLEEFGKDVLFTREPGGVKGAEEIRKLFSQRYKKDRWSNITEILLFFLPQDDIIWRKYYFLQLIREKL